MERVWRHFRAASVTAGVGGLVLASCAHDDSSFFVAQIVVPPVPVANQGCLYTASNGTVPGLFSGSFDVGLSSTYSPVALLGNQLNARSDQLNVRTETARINVRGAVVRVTDSQGNQISTFTSLSEGTVDPETGTTPGFGLAAVTLVDPATSKGLKDALPTRDGRRTIVSYFKVFGNTLGGTYVETAEYQHVISVCNGCLVAFPADAELQDTTSAKYPHPNCLAGLPAGSTGGGGGTLALPCVLGQDQPTDCRLCQGLEACDPAKLR
jgi:hypothetical protein